MPNCALSATLEPQLRLRSLDVFRGLVILAMLFVNDIAGVQGVPEWLKHADFRSNGMTVVDVVFPAFLFMVGMALPFALGKRLETGASLGRVWAHIGIRSGGLMLLGLFMVIADSVQPGGVLSPAAWTLGGYLGVILVWHAYDTWQAKHPWRVRAFRLGGALVIFAVLAFFHGPKGDGFSGLSPRWWGILGIIGWAYLAACVIYVPGRRHPEAILGGGALLGLLAMAAPFALGSWPGWSLGIVGSFAPHGLIVLMGALLGVMLQVKPESVQSLSVVVFRVRWTLLFAGGLYLASALLHTLSPLHGMFTVSKLLGTVTWCLRCSAYSALLWLLIYLVVDVWKKNPGTDFLAMAGGNALLAYILSPLSVAIWDVAAGHLKPYDALGETLLVGFLRALGSAFLLTWLAGFLRRKGLNLKL